MFTKHQKNNRPNNASGKRNKKNYTRKSVYEMNFYCFDIKDFRKMDSITVYCPKTKERIKGIVVDTEIETRDIIYNTATSNREKTNINNVLFLKEYDKNWLE